MPSLLRAMVCIAFLSTVVGCLPGGIIMPIPVSHYDRPEIRGILLKDGRPVSSRIIEAVSFKGQPAASCNRSGAHARTNYLGEFELVGDKDSWTIWWGDDVDGFSICLPETEGAIWSRDLKRSEFPPFIPGHVDVVCTLAEEKALDCTTSLDDAKMIDCTDDLDYEYPVGWLDAKERTPFTGRCVTYYDNGQLLERADFVQGIRVGLWIGYSEDGLRDHQSYWIDGRHRRATVWHPNGQKFRQTHYRATADERGFPVLHGLNTIWTKDGSIESQKCWVHGAEQDIAPDECYFD